MDLNFLEAAPAADVIAPVANPEPAPEPAPQSEGPARVPGGKFAAKEPEAAPVQAPTPEPTPAPQASEPAKPEPGYVPIQAMLDARDKAQAAQARADTLAAQVEQYQRQAQPPAATPDPFEDPAGFQAFQEQQLQQTQWNAVTSISQVMAVKEHGQAVVDEATQAFAAEVAQKPWLAAELRRQAHPYDYVVQRHQRETAFADVKPDEIAQFRAWKSAQGQIQAAQPAIPPNPAPPTPPASLASAPNAGGAVGHVPVGPGQAYDALPFNR